MKELIKNDFQFLRSWLIGWGALLILPVLFFAALRTALGWDPGYWKTLSVVLTPLFLMQIVYAILLVAMLVQKEGPSDSRAYWLTRPMCRRTLPFAKLIGVAGFVVLPVLVQAALLGGAFPGGFEAVAEGVLHMGLMSGFVVLLCLPGAVLTRNIGQALLVGLGIPVSIALLDAFFLKWIRIPIQTGIQNQLPPGVPLNTMIFGLLFFLVVGGYLRSVWAAPGGRRRWMNFIPAFLCILLGVNMTPSPRPIPEQTMNMPPDASLVVESLTFNKTREKTSGGTTTQVSKEQDLWMEGGALSSYGITGKTVWGGLPEHWLVLTEPVMSYDANGTVLSPGNHPRGFSRAYQFLRSSYKRSLFPDYDPEGKVSYIPGNISFFSSPKIKPEELQWPAEFFTVFATRVYEPEKVPMTFSEGARWSLNGRRIVVERIERLADRTLLHLQFLGGTSEGRHEKPPFEGGLFALRDPTTRAVSFNQPMHTRRLSVYKHLTLGRMEIEFQDFQITAESMHQVECYFIRHHFIGTDVRKVPYVVGTSPSGEAD